MANKGIDILIKLPTTFSIEDSKKIKEDILDFFEKKKHYGAYHGKKEGIKVKTILWCTNDK